MDVIDSLLAAPRPICIPERYREKGGAGARQPTDQGAVERVRRLVEGQVGPAGHLLSLSQAAARQSASRGRQLSGEVNFC